MTIFKKLFPKKETPKLKAGICDTCDNFYGQYIVRPDMTDIRNVKVMQFTCRNYCIVHKCSMPETLDPKGKACVNVANCKQWEKLKT